VIPGSQRWKDPATMLVEGIFAMVEIIISQAVPKLQIEFSMFWDSNIISTFHVESGKFSTKLVY